jgi:hypothetical protein
MVAPQFRNLLIVSTRFGIQFAKVLSRMEPQRLTKERSMPRNSKSLTETKSNRRSKANNRRGKKRTSRKVKISKLLPALIIEALAVAAILALFFGMRAELNREARLEISRDNAVSHQMDVAAPFSGVKSISRLSIYMAN